MNKGGPLCLTWMRNRTVIPHSRTLQDFGPLSLAIILSRLSLSWFVSSTRAWHKSFLLLHTRAQHKICKHARAQTFLPDAHHLNHCSQHYQVHRKPKGVGCENTFVASRSHCITHPVTWAEGSHFVPRMAPLGGGVVFEEKKQEHKAPKVTPSLLLPLGGPSWQCPCSGLDISSGRLKNTACTTKSPPQVVWMGWAVRGGWRVCMAAMKKGGGIFGPHYASFSHTGRLV